VPADALAKVEERVQTRCGLIGMLEKTRIKQDGDSVTLKHLLRRPEVDWKHLVELAPWLADYDTRVLNQVETEVKYEGYIRRELKRARDLSRKEGKRIPGWLDYASVPGLSLEATEKLGRIRPRSLGQAARVPGITPADVSTVLIHIEKHKRMAGHG
jgi:tRNA uridine 5-carboxymethylaminomethyl modification enzyme